MDWWSRYGHFRKGLYGLPHMGDVITCYSIQRGFKNQEAFARAAGVSNECNRTFTIHNTSAVHHERAKALLQLYMLDEKKHHLNDAENEIHLARKTLTPELVEWHMYFDITEAKLYLAQREVEASALAAKQAFTTSELLSSQIGEEEIKDVYLSLKQIDENNPDVINLGVRLGYF